MVMRFSMVRVGAIALIALLLPGTVMPCTTDRPRYGWPNHR